MFTFYYSIPGSRGTWETDCPYNYRDACQYKEILGVLPEDCEDPRVQRSRKVYTDRLTRLLENSFKGK